MVHFLTLTSCKPLGQFTIQVSTQMSHTCSRDQSHKRVPTSPAQGQGRQGMRWAGRLAVCAAGLAWSPSRGADQLAGALSGGPAAQLELWPSLPSRLLQERGINEKAVCAPPGLISPWVSFSTKS